MKWRLESQYLTDPNRAQSQSLYKTLQVISKKVLFKELNQTLTHSTVSSGKATPVLANVSNPAARSINFGVGMSDPTASMAVLAAGITSFPIPSAGMRPIVSVLRVAVARDRIGVLNIVFKRKLKVKNSA